MDAIRTLGLTCPVEAVNDALIGLLAGAEAGWGVALISGTGNNCWGWDRARTRMGHVTGNGMMFGEYGGASDLVWKALCAVAAAWGRRGPATLLTELFMAQTGADSPERLLEGLSQDELSLGAEAAPLVFQAADAGDAVAAKCITWSGRELGSLAAGVIRQLGVEELEFEIVQVGSMHNGGWRIFEPMAETIHDGGPGRTFCPAGRTAGGRRGAARHGGGRAGCSCAAPRADRLNACIVGGIEVRAPSENAPRPGKGGERSSDPGGS